MQIRFNNRHQSTVSLHDLTRVGNKYDLGESKIRELFTHIFSYTTTHSEPRWANFGNRDMMMYNLAQSVSDN